MTIAKNTVTRISAAIFAAIVLSIFLVLNTVSFNSFAAETENVTETAVSTDTEEITNDEDETFTVDGVEFTALANDNTYEVVQLAAGGAGGAGGAAGGGASGSATADSSYKSVINFFITWLRRIGAMVALIGAIMFGLAIKNNDADQKQNGLLTMVAGFVVFAICLASDMFDLFS